MKNDRWVKRWKVDGSNGNKWTVAIDKTGNYGCSCPLWKFKRLECHHIKLIKNGGGIEYQEKPKPEYVLASVFKPTYEEKTNRLLVPLIAIPDTHLMEATICYYMLKHGYSMGEIREIRGHIPPDWSAKRIIDHVEHFGEAEYPESWYEH